ncbi:hypothetical protein RJ640_015766 [Escallonia rubra]|uniref:CCHC-type domain-containing protein n=1 Tax=Escallonia rubra TaxID=112253 RepID=A0AA88Q9V9_9ASTE|nr:hypothetical protein RJ640_015766 [Escallonia rubra]
MAKEGKGKIEKFNGMNFQWWKMQVEDYLYQKDLYLPLVGEKPEAMNASEWAILDRKALATVRLSLTPQVAFNISKEKTIAAVMKALEKLYEKPSASNKVFLMKKLFNMRMSENGSVVDHLNDFNGVTNQLESVGINFDDEIRALLFLCSLPDSWNNLVTTVSNSTISGTLTLNDVVSSVMNDEMRRKTIGNGVSSSTALSVESRGRQNNKQNNRGRSPTRGRSKSRGKSKSKGRTIVCWNCNKEGHKKNDCTEPKKKKGAGGRQGDDEGANMVSSNERTYDDLCLSATVDDNSKVCIVGKGKVKIKLSNGGTLILNDVRHIPELQKNLISVSGLDREGYFVAFGEKQWKVTKGSMVVARGERVGTLYTLSEDKEYMELDEPEDGRIPKIESPEVLDETTDTEIGAGDQQQVLETLNLRKSSRLAKLVVFDTISLKIHHRGDLSLSSSTMMYYLVHGLEFRSGLRLIIDDIYVISLLKYYTSSGSVHCIWIGYRSDMLMIKNSNMDQDDMALKSGNATQEESH